jgi:hypothetical protein
VDLFTEHLISGNLSLREESMLDYWVSSKMGVDVFVGYFLARLHFHLQTPGNGQLKLPMRLFVTIKNKYFMILSSKNS